MKEYINHHSIANTIRMTRSQHPGAFLLVEGETDSRVYRRFVKGNLCRLIPAINKKNATGALRILEKANFDGILTIVDADFWHVENYTPDTPNLLVTDTHDLETMILSSEEVVEKLLSEFGGRNKIAQLKKSECSVSPMEMVLTTAMPIGLLRWHSSPSKDNIQIKFRSLLLFENLDKFINPTQLALNIPNLLSEAQKYITDEKKLIDIKVLEKKIKSALKENFNPWEICNGHDVVQILTLGLRSAFGNKNSKSLEPKVVEGMVRGFYEYYNFRCTRLYESIKNWEKNNPGFTVLKPLE